MWHKNGKGSSNPQNMEHKNALHVTSILYLVNDITIIDYPLLFHKLNSFIIFVSHATLSIQYRIRL